MWFTFIGSTFRNKLPAIWKHVVDAPTKSEDNIEENASMLSAIEQLILMSRQSCLTLKQSLYQVCMALQ